MTIFNALQILLLITKAILVNDKYENSYRAAVDYKMISTVMRAAPLFLITFLTAWQWFSFELTNQNLVNTREDCIHGNFVIPVRACRCVDAASLISHILIVDIKRSSSQGTSKINQTASELPTCTSPLRSRDSHVH